MRTEGISLPSESRFFGSGDSEGRYCRERLTHSGQSGAAALTKVPVLRGKWKRGRERSTAEIRKTRWNMERLKFIGKRLIYLVVMLFGVATLVFILTKMIPGDPTVANLSQRALNDPEVVAAYRAKYGLDQPVFVQYISCTSKICCIWIWVRLSVPISRCWMSWPDAIRLPLSWRFSRSFWRRFWVSCSASFPL